MATVLPTEDEIEARAIYESIYNDFGTSRARDLSIAERTRCDYNSSTLSYGEIGFEAMEQILNKLTELGLECGRHSHFVDVGCGVGKCVIAAALLRSFSSCQGIEILRDLSEVCHLVLKRWSSTCARLRMKSKLQIDLHFQCGDGLAIDWSRGSVVILSATTFNNEMMARLVEKAERLRPDSFLVSISRPISSEVLEFVGKLEIEASWGPTTAHIYQRLHMEASDFVTDREFLQSFGIESH